MDESEVKNNNYCQTGEMIALSIDRYSRTSVRLMYMSTWLGVSVSEYLLGLLRFILILMVSCVPVRPIKDLEADVHVVVVLPFYVLDPQVEK